MIPRIVALSLFLLPVCLRADMQEIAFSIQGTQVTWFEVNNPTLQGNLNFSVPAPVGNAQALSAGNGLAYDPGANRILFVDSNEDQDHSLWSINLTGLTFQPGVNQNVTLNNIGNIHFLTTTPGLYGADFYNGSYYTLRNGTDSLVKVDFNGGGTISGFSEPNLPGTPTPFLGDVAFKLQSGLTDFYISGDNANQVPSAANARLWHYTTSNGTTFTAAATNPIVPNQIRYNGMFFSQNGTLYGYRLGTNEFGIIDQTTGTFTETSMGNGGVPFAGGGDLSPGPIVNVVPEPPVAALFGFGFLTLLGVLKRRRAA